MRFLSIFIITLMMSVIANASYNHWMFSNKQGSYYYWLNGTKNGSLYYWKHGNGPGSKNYWENGAGAGSKYYWENSRVSNLSSKFHWENGIKPGSKNYWENGTDIGSLLHWNNGKGMTFGPNFIALCLSGSINITPCEKYVPNILIKESINQNLDPKHNKKCLK